MIISERNKYILVFLLGAITFWGYNKYAFPTVDKRIKSEIVLPTVGVIGAMEIEVNSLKDSMDIDTMINKAGLKFYKGTLGNQKVVLVRSGVGKVNAAMATQFMIDNFSVSSIINTGIAGGVSEGIEVGDVIIAKSVRYNDFDVTKFGYRLGQVPFMDTSIFYSDRIMMSKMLKKSRALGLKSKYGNISSGDRFIADADLRKEVLINFKSDGVEMESAAIAHVCYLNKVAFVIVRTISDGADGNAVENYEEFEKTTANKSAQLTLEYLKLL